MKSINLYLVVAGATYFSQLDRFQGWSGTPLTEAGKRASAAVGDELAAVDFATAFAADTSRSVQTAEQILAVGDHRPKLQLDAALRAPFFGGFEGADRADTWSSFATRLGYASVADFASDQTPNELQTLLHDHDQTSLAEDGPDFWTRYLQGLQRVLQATPAGQTALVIVDSANLRAVIHQATGENPTKAQLRPNSWVQVGYDGDNLTIKQEN